MDTLQRSSGMLSALSLTGLVMSDVYFYRRLNGMQNEIDQVTDSISNFSKTDQAVAIMNNNIRELGGAVGEMQKELKELREFKAQHEESLEEIHELKNYIVDIIEELEKNGIDVELSSMKPKKLSQMTQKKKSRVVHKPEPKDEDEEEDAVSFVQRLRSKRS